MVVTLYGGPEDGRDVAIRNDDKFVIICDAERVETSRYEKQPTGRFEWCRPEPQKK